MSGHFSPGDKIRNQLRNERGSAVRVLLLVLLLVAAAAGYLYYFTDYLRPRQEAAKPPVAQTAQVKQPIPPRPGQPGEKEAVSPKPGDAKPPQGAPAPSAAAVPAPLQAKAQTEQIPAPPPPARPEPVKTAKAEAPAKLAPPAVAAPKPSPASAAPAPAVKKVLAPAQPVRNAEKADGKKKGGAYRLLIGDFVPDKSFAELQAKLKKSGIAPVRTSTLQAPEPMNRLYVADFTEQDKAEAALQKIKKLTADAFLISENGKYLLYAGSYFSASRAAAELKKLSAKGVTPVIKKAQVTIKVTRVTAGSYASSEEARNDALRLKKQGLAATVIKAEKKR
jgi:cell division septation protein DedD